ncbi:lipopolysaccharide biosynthesis protein [uncultured Polaribacter sp.]|uniref:lipopolysaccharide biosynthesis protein n=1 Tax=uncultured Polaribacter sp. TaxID=174711 RepID=UPI0026374315|nr:lipopolysaccharide biosynthesis protein [uncultured Polaribacter sp.]
MTLKKQTFSGVLWTFMDTFLVKGIMFIAMILLARWIGPEDFGLIGMIAVFVAIGKSLTDSGMANSLIRTKEPDQSDFSTVFIVNIVMSILVYTILYFTAPFIADFFGHEILINIIRIYCLLFLIIAFSAVQLAILTKRMEFKKITKINFPSTIIGVALGLYLGYNEYGVWSVVWMYLGTELIRSVLLWFFSDWKPKFIFSKSKFNFHFKFGYKLVLSGLLDTVFKNVYNILIGRYFSAQMLGFYERSKQFSEYPSATLTGVISKVTYPMLSQIQEDPKRLETIYRKLIRVSFFIIAPLMLGLAAIAKPLFLILLGDEWLPAVLFFQILTFAMMLYPIHAFNINILKVYGRSDLFLKLEIIKKIIISISVIIAFQFGVIGLVLSSVFTSFAALAVNMFYSSKLIDYPVFKQIKDLSITLIIAIFVAFLMYKTTTLLPNALNIVQMILASLVGVIVYLGINYLVKTSPLHQVISLLKTRNL